MKVKLLKKVRKLYNIIYKPNSLPYPKIIIEGPNKFKLSRQDSNVSVLYEVEIIHDIDTHIKIRVNKSRTYNGITSTKKEGYKLALNWLQQFIVEEYSQYGTRRNLIQSKQEKLWFK